MARIAQDEHPNVKLDEGDWVIFSSRTIPGNEKAVARVQNALGRHGGRGHHRPGRGRSRLRAIRAAASSSSFTAGSSPTSPFRCTARAGTSKPMPSSPRGSACEQVVRARNGTMVRLLPGPAEIIDDVPVGRLYRDGTILTRADDGQVRERRKLSFAGSVAVSLVLSEKGVLLADPEVAVTGLASRRQRRNAVRRDRPRRRDRHHREPAQARSARTRRW